MLAVNHTPLNIYQHKLIQQVETRWNSVYYMLSRYIEQEEAVKLTLCLLDKSELIIPTDKVSLLKDAVEVLKPFEAATTEMGAEQNLSASKIIPISRGLQKLTSCTTTTLGISLTRQMANRFPAGMEEFPLVALPTLLDPRFKR